MALRKSLLPLLVAVFLGLGAAVFAQNWMKGRIAAVEAEKLNGVPVVIAVREIPFGEKITAGDLKVIGWPYGNVPEGVFSEPTEVLGKVANQKILPGEPVLKSRAVQMGGGSSLAALIEPNMRAVTVRVNDVIGVGGFLLPGNRVDVLASRSLEGSQKRVQTRTLLNNVKVLAVDQTALAEKDKPVVVRAVTLEVDPRQAERLVQATEEGTVQMALRNPDDSSVIEETETVAATPPVVVRPRTRSRVEVTQSPPPAEAPTVTVIRQTQVGKSAD